MSNVDVLLSVLIGTIIMIAVVGIITWAINRTSKNKKTRGMVFLGKLANTDFSIEQAMDYLKLTNSISDKMNGSV